jgi:DNA adenine methylase
MGRLVRYLGAKPKIAGALSAYITAHEGDMYVEPFLGSGAVFLRAAPHYPKAIASDANPDLMLMWRAIADGWLPPMVLTKTRWLELRADPNPSPERSFAGFACSYGGSWFGGYIQDRTTATTGKRRDYTDQARRSVVKIGRALARFHLETCDYTAHTPLMRPGVVVYCDPPYRDTQEYVGTEHYRGAFNHDRFWATMEEWSEAGATVLVSEYTAPEGWKAGWSERKTAWAGGTRRTESIESVWVRVT